MSFLRNLLMAVIAIGAALLAAMDVMIWLRPSPGTKGGWAPPFWRPLLAAVATGFLVILLFRVWQPKPPAALRRRRSTPPSPTPRS